MSVKICPYCKDFTEQNELFIVPNKDKTHMGIESTSTVSFCYCCEEMIEHEFISMSKPNPLLLRKKRVFQVNH